MTFRCRKWRSKYWDNGTVHKIIPIQNDPAELGRTYTYQLDDMSANRIYKKGNVDVCN
jgi:hypothetical protein